MAIYRKKKKTLLQGILESSKIINQENYWRSVPTNEGTIHNYSANDSCIDNMATNNKLLIELFQNWSERAFAKVNRKIIK